VGKAMKTTGSIVFIVLLVVSILHLPEIQADSRNSDEDKPVYYYGIMPVQKGQPLDEIRTIYKPILTWLGAEVGCRFILVHGQTYEDIINMVVDGKVQVATLGPVPYVIAKKKNAKLKLLASELYWDAGKKKPHDSYSGYILALKTREDIKMFQDFKGKKFAFVNRQSTSGYRYPKFLLSSKGLTLEDFFAKTFFLGSHPRVTDAIAAGSVDGGATYNYNFRQAVKKHGNVFKVIVESPPMPSQAIVAHPSLPDDICAKIQKALPTIDPALLKGIGGYGYVIRKDSFYDFVRSIIRQSEKIKAN